MTVDLTHMYDPLDTDTLVDPYPVYAALRERSPVFWHETMRSWVVLRYEDCRSVLRDHELFARDRRRLGEDVPEFRQSLQSLDPPAQGPLRSLLMNSFRRQNPTAIAAGARARIDERFAELAQRESFDWMWEVAAPVALEVTSDLLGVEKPDPEHYAWISDGIARRMDAGLVPERAAVGDRARHALNALVENWLGADERPGVLEEIRRDAPRADVPEHYISNTAGVMFNASYGTIFATAGNVALTLAERPWVLEALGRDPELLPSAVDELIRFDGPAQGTSRVSVVRQELAGVVVEGGDIVLTLIAAANRDPEEFPSPDDLVLDRAPNRHLGFGWGPHACVGAVFGRAAIRELILGLARAGVAPRLVGTPTRRPTATVRTIGTLPMAFEPVAATRSAG